MADEYESTTPRDPDVVERTTIVTDRGSGGGGGVLAVVILLIAVLALLYVFRGQLGLGGTNTTTIKVPDKINVNVN